MLLKVLSSTSYVFEVTIFYNSASKPHITFAKLFKILVKRARIPKHLVMITAVISSVQSFHQSAI